MFRENNAHLQQSFFTSENYMNPSVHARLLKSWAYVFYNFVFCRIKESVFAVLYCLDNGRPNFPVNILLSLEYIKHLFNYTDEELVEQFYFNYQISYALGIKNVGEMNLCPGTLYEFRRRLYNYLIENPEKGDLIFEQFINLTKEFVKETDTVTDEQRMDSTMISANIKNAGRLALAYDVLEQALRVISEEKMTDDMKKILDTNFKKKTLYKSKNTQIESKIQEVLNICEEVANIAKSIPEIQDSKEIKVLERFISEQTIIDAESGERKVKESKKIEGSSLQSAYDEEATFRRKGKKSGKGYSVNIAETCSEENATQFITHYDVKSNTTADETFAEEDIPKIKTNFDVTDMYVDGAYSSKNVREVAEANNVNMHYTDMTGKKVDGAQTPTKDFEFNADKTVNMCPASVHPIDTRYNSENGNISAHFSKEACQNCEFKDKCCVKEQKKAYKFSTTEKKIASEKFRENMIEERKENASKRAAIEGTNSELKSNRHGLDDVRVRGQKKVCINTGLKITACNIKRFAKNILKTIQNQPNFVHFNSELGIAMQF